MKFNAQHNNSRAGMTLLELTVVILVLLSLISILFAASRAWKRGSDRSANIMNIRNCQQAMRGEQNMKQLNPAAGADPADPFVRSDLEEFMQFPSSVNAEVTYPDPKNVITVESGVVGDPTATSWDHIWLNVSTAGMPDDLDGTGYGHGEVAETTGW